MDIKTIAFIAISAVTLASAGIVAFSRNLIYSAFALLGVFVGVFGLYILLSADFVAIVQLIIYIGGILILILFAVMLTTRISEKRTSNKRMEPIAALIGVSILGFVMWQILSRSTWFALSSERYVATASSIGDKLLKEYLLPFEAVSLLLVLVLVGAVVVGRRGIGKSSTKI